MVKRAAAPEPQSTRPFLQSRAGSLCPAASCEFPEILRPGLGPTCMGRPVPLLAFPSRHRSFPQEPTIQQRQRGLDRHTGWIFSKTDMRAQRISMVTVHTVFLRFFFFLALKCKTTQPEDGSQLTGRRRWGGWEPREGGCTPQSLSVALTCCHFRG